MALAPDFAVGQGETDKTWTAVLKDGSGTAIDLTNATNVKMHWADSGGILTVNASATIVSPATAGKVSYKPVAADVATAGAYQAEWLINWNDGTTTYVPDSTAKLFVLVAAKLG